MKEQRRRGGAEEGKRSVAGLLKELASDGAALVRQEILLARVEIRDNLRSLALRAGQMAVGGGMAGVGLLVLVAFAIIALGVLLGGTYWLSSLIVALVLLAGGGLMIFSGVRRLGRTSMAPQETVDSLKTTGQWAQGEVRKLRAGVGGNGADGAGPAVRLERITPESRPARRGGVVSLESRPGPEEGPGDGEDTTGYLGRPPLSQPLHKRVMNEFGDDDIPGQGAKVAFYMFTSLPPALLVIFALAGLFGGEALGDYLSAEIQRMMPGNADDPNSAAGFLTQFIDQVVETNAPGPLSIGLVMGLWAASAVFVALMEALNRAYDAVEDRSWFRKRAISIAVMIGFLLLFLVGSVVLIAGPQIAEALQLGEVGNIAWTVLQWPLAFAMIALAFFLAYYVLPNRDQSAQKATLFKASAIAGVLWVAATFGFRIYIRNFGSYGETYGFVGAILVLLLWMYLTSIVILLGGEIASEMEREAKA